MSVIDNYYSWKFIYLLTQKWEDTDAFKLGIIDDSGKQLKKIRQLKTSEEKASYTKFHKLVYKLKVMLEKVPFAKSTVGRYATAILLIKEELKTDTKYVEESFLTHVQECDTIIKESIHQIVLEEDIDSFTEVFGMYFLTEDDDLNLVDEMVSTGGIDMGAGSSKKKKNPFYEEDDDNGDETFAGNAVFNCCSNTFQNCRLGKRKYLKYKTFVGEDEVGERIRLYGRKNPARGIVLKNSTTGAMIYLRKGKGQV